MLFIYGTIHFFQRSVPFVKSTIDASGVVLTCFQKVQVWYHSFFKSWMRMGIRCLIFAKSLCEVLLWTVMEKSQKSIEM